MEQIIFKLHKRKTKKHYLTDLSKPRLSDELLFFIPLFGFSVCDRTRPSVKLIKDEREMKEEIAGGADREVQTDGRTERSSSISTV